jgi:hypothetical protein
MTTDADILFKLTMKYDLKSPAGKTMLVHIALIRELLQLKPPELIQQRDARDSVANGHTKDSIDRKMRWQLTRGRQPHVHAFKVFFNRVMERISKQYFPSMQHSTNER